MTELNLPISFATLFDSVFRPQLTTWRLRWCPKTQVPEQRSCWGSCRHTHWRKGLPLPHCALSLWVTLVHVFLSTPRCRKVCQERECGSGPFPLRAQQTQCSIHYNMVRQAHNRKRTDKLESCVHSKMLWLILCGDITNTLVGISGETVPEGGNLRIYWPLSNHAIWWVMVFTAGVSHHTPPPPGGRGAQLQFLQFLIFWIFS